MGGAAALPDDGMVDGFAGLAVPDNRGFPLVGNADSGDLGGLNPRRLQGLLAGFFHRAPNLIGVMLNPAGLGEILGEFLVGAPHHLARVVKEVSPGAGGALVDGEDKFGHWYPQNYLA